jgi:hypothetical protein
LGAAIWVIFRILLLNAAGTCRAGPDRRKAASFHARGLVAAAARSAL